MSTERDWWRGWWWRNVCCAIPPVAGLLVFIFLLPQIGSGNWKLSSGAQESLKFKELLTGTDALNNNLKAALSDGSNYYTLEQLTTAASAPGVAAWRLSTGLALVVIVVGLFISGWVIGRAPRGLSGWRGVRGALVTFVLVAAVLAVFLFGAGFIWPSTAMTRQFLESIQTRLGDSRLVDWELGLTYVGYIMGVYLLCASGAVLLSGSRAGGENGPPERTASEEVSHLVRQMRDLRLLLYAGAVALVITTLRARMSFKWALDYLPPLTLLGKEGNLPLAAAVVYQRLESLVSNVVTSVAVLNSLLLAAVYVPATLILQKRAEDVTTEVLTDEKAHVADALAAEAAEAKSRLPPAWLVPHTAVERPEKPRREAPAREEWMKARGLSFPLKEHLGRIAAILSPLLAGPVAELLLLLKS